MDQDKVIGGCGSVLREPKRIMPPPRYQSREVVGGVGVGDRDTIRSILCEGQMVSFSTWASVVGKFFGTSIIIEESDWELTENEDL